jgi:hypothetical protein
MRYFKKIFSGFFRGYSDYVLWFLLAIAIWHSLRSLSMLG